MARIEKTIFISYRRADVYTALAVYENLKNQGYDVFFDYRSISSGDFEQIITSNIRARAHFILILTPTALDRCNEPGDWLRREIELAIDEKRNIVPLFFRGFRFGTHVVSDKMTGKLKNLGRYNGLNVHEDYFEEAMNRLCTEYLSKPLDTVLHPVSTDVRKVVTEEQNAADEAIKQKEKVKERNKQANDKLEKQKVIRPQVSVGSAPASTSQKQQEESKETGEEVVQKKVLPKYSTSHPVESKPINYRSRKTTSILPIMGFVSLVGGLFLILLCIWGGTSLWNSLQSNTQSLPPTPIATLISPKDDMTLLYVPAGEFTMGGDRESDERPIHSLYLDAFWIDQTEITNNMYAECVRVDVCEPPLSLESFTRKSYFNNNDFADYPVIYIVWSDANKYCEWAGRRLPTEAEWEKAARGENAFEFPWGNSDPNVDLVNYAQSVGDTTMVGAYPDNASPYGALDMAGNVWEWVEDWYDGYPDNVTDWGVYGTTFRVARGGAWNNYWYDIRPANREYITPTSSGANIGFRCAMDANP